MRRIFQLFDRSIIPVSRTARKPCPATWERAATIGQSKTLQEITGEMKDFSVSRFAVLVDDATNQSMLEAIPPGAVGYFTFTAAMAGQRIASKEIDLLARREQLEMSPAWLIATDSKAGHELSHFLFENNLGDRLIFTLSQARVAPIYAQLDFFHGETETAAYITNYFERAYKIHFPLAMRFLLRRSDGEICLSWQEIIAPNHTLTIKSAELALTRPFVGYLEVYCDVRALNEDVSPFLHFNSDYISMSGIATIHQSGFKPWPAGSRFTRAVLPLDGRQELTVSMFNRESVEPIACRAELRAVRAGQYWTVERDLPPLRKSHVQFVNLSCLFGDELKEAEGAIVAITADRPMHRPNFYSHPRNASGQWTAVEHGAAVADELVSGGERARFAELEIHPWMCAFPLLPEQFGIDTEIIYLEPGAADLRSFQCEVFDSDGRCRAVDNLALDIGGRVNIADWLGRRAIQPNGGLARVTPATDAPRVSRSFSFLIGLKSRRHLQSSVTVCGGALTNIPFEWQRDWMWSHPALPTQHTEQFGRALVDGEYDTIVVLTNASAQRNYARVASIEIDIYTAAGRMERFYKTIAPNSAIVFRFSELLRDSRLSQVGCFSFWIYCRDCSIYGLHVLQRKSDFAVGLQHLYYSRFNRREEEAPLLPARWTDG